MNLNDLEKVHPMKQITVASIVQVLVFGFMLLAFWGNSKLFADEIVFKFNSPSFSGIGTSSHYLTIQNQEFNRKEALKGRDKSTSRPDRKRQREYNTCKIYKKFRV
jgi:hypothetical protein